MLTKEQYADRFTEVIRRASTRLPRDVADALRDGWMAEERESLARKTLGTILSNVEMARENVAPICQDTGMPAFEIKTPVGANQIVMRRQIEEAIVEATKGGHLRPNSVNSLTGKNSGNNLGDGTPVIHFEQWEEDEIEVRLILKGGGCENKNIQYSLPCELPQLGRADRTLDGVRKCIMHAVYQAQGYGCSVGAVGVAVGGGAPLTTTRIRYWLAVPLLVSLPRAR